MTSWARKWEPSYTEGNSLPTSMRCSNIVKGCWRTSRFRNTSPWLIRHCPEMPAVSCSRASYAVMFTGARSVVSRLVQALGTRRSALGAEHCRGAASCPGESCVCVAQLSFEYFSARVLGQFVGHNDKLRDFISCQQAAGVFDH